jgi:hypothetical protein
MVLIVELHAALKQANFLRVFSISIFVRFVAEQRTRLGLLETDLKSERVRFGVINWIAGFHFNEIDMKK